jgi:dTDP-4-dehydrorhamnose reductase
VTPELKLKVLITGAGGQIGSELQATAPRRWQVVSCTSSQLDVTQVESVHSALQRERPSVVFHTAAYTDVDRAEQEPDRAAAVNTEGAALVAAAARDVGARMIYLSTDYVFDGAAGQPYLPDDPALPLSVYGKTKLAGEQAVVAAAGSRHLIVRTAWVYSAHGRNFVRTMLHMMKSQESVRIVSDQVGTPTWARRLAQALWCAVEQPLMAGTLHWTDAGVASWYDFALAIQEEAVQLGLLQRAIPIYPIRTSDFPRPARRPSYSVLDKTTGWKLLGGPAPHWRSNLKLMLAGLSHA